MAGALAEAKHLGESFGRLNKLLFWALLCFYSNDPD
jgi:hypothetical protein